MQAETNMAAGAPDRQCYQLALQAIDAMHDKRAWPTPLNYRLWTESLREPQGVVGLELERLIRSGEALTDTATEALAARVAIDAGLALGAVIELQDAQDAGMRLNDELHAISSAMTAVRRSSESFEAVLEGAVDELAGPQDAPGLQQLLSRLALDTRQVRAQRDVLQGRLDTSTVEIARLRRSVEHSRREARTDALTGLPNRQFFDDALVRTVDGVCGSPISLAMLDIDHFKRFNDSFGHQTGDQVLRYVGGVMTRFSTDARIGARYGGEEFALLFPGETAEQAGAAVKLLMDEVSAAALKRRSSNQDLGVVTLSAGVAELAAGETVDEFLARADEALYASKRTGRNRITMG